MSKFVAQIAFVPNTPHIEFAEITRVSAAIQKQVTRDLAPIWDINATIDAISTLEQVPLGYWPIIIGGEELPEHTLGTHLDQHNQPYALVKNTTGWSLAASHECLEMLVNPFGCCMTAGKSPSEHQGRVLFLTEVCNPCAGPDNAYTVNDILVSDFCMPEYFNMQPMSSMRYDFTGNIKAPCTALRGGYLSWRNPQDGQYYQLQCMNGNQQIVALGEMRGNPREMVDRHQKTPHTLRQPMVCESQKLRTAQEQAWTTGQITAAWAREMRRCW
jgi:hypothetical protein